MGLWQMCWNNSLPRGPIFSLYLSCSFIYLINFFVLSFWIWDFDWQENMKNQHPAVSRHWTQWPLVYTTMNANACQAIDYLCLLSFEYLIHLLLLLQLVMLPRQSQVLVAH